MSGHLEPAIVQVSLAALVQVLTSTREYSSLSPRTALLMQLRPSTNVLGSSLPLLNASRCRYRCRLGKAALTGVLINTLLYQD
jgi:hypothetical protein